LPAIPDQVVENDSKDVPARHKSARDEKLKLQGVRMAWSLHPKLAADTLVLGDLALCRVLLMNDANYPWLILVPRREGAVEIIDLAEDDRTRLMTEIADVSRALRDHTRCDKLNVAALGNAVPQLHVHVIARFRDDAAGPNPVWGRAPAKAYAPGAQEKLANAMHAALALGA
jgi:diadenosine tetraphosphate (Ap4A) HIT family hydrolase